MVRIEELKWIAQRINELTYSDRRPEFFIIKDKKNRYSEENFYPLSEQFKDNIWFIDGSNNKLWENSLIRIDKIRIVAVQYPTHELRIIEGYAFQQGEHIEGIGAIRELLKEYNGTIEDYRSRLEAILASRLGIVVMDGSLQDMGNETIIGISKDTGIVMDNNIPATVFLSRRQGPWIYRDAIIQENIRTGFIRLAKNSRIYRIDYHEFELARSIASRLKEMNSLKLGYPWPLIEAHRIAVITNREIAMDRALLRGMIKDVEQLEDIHDMFEELT
ncbi:hypothetical protein J7K74_02560 [Candidatus Woesearchaeota archaeon]|nr:hypothetical protein [Candidatus Woesearchaeota archaeon]